MSERYPELEHMSGGEKSLFIRQHKEEILQCYHQKGGAYCLREYHLQSTTLERLLKAPGYIPNSELSPGDKASLMVQRLEADNRELKKEIQRLRAEYLLFTDTVSDQLSDKLFKPFLRAVIQLPDSLEEKLEDRTSLNDVM